MCTLQNETKINQICLQFFLCEFVTADIIKMMMSILSSQDMLKFSTTISLDWQINIERLNVYMTNVTNVATYVPCKMKQKSTKYVYNFFFEFFTADNKNYAYILCIAKYNPHHGDGEQKKKVVDW